MTLHLRVAALTDLGRVRESNEDAFVVASLGAPIAAPLGPGQDADFGAGSHPLLLAVADGMGGHAAGEVAAALAVESLRTALPPTSPDWGSTLRDAVQLANRAVWTAGQLPSRAGMGSTLTAVCVHGDEAHVAEVGDSRAYLFRGGKLTALTKDQSFVQALVDAGAMSAAEARTAPAKNIIMSAMGQKEGVRVEIGRIRLADGDVLLVCSDGLSNEVPDDELSGLLSGSSTPSVAAAALVARANEHGGHDNVTVVVAAVHAAGTP